MAVEAGKSGSCRVGQQAGHVEESMLWFQSQGHLLWNQKEARKSKDSQWENSVLFRGGHWFCSIQAIKVCEAHPHYGGQSALFKVPQLKC
jgi:isopentenyldiphosphate isomerase